MIVEWKRGDPREVTNKRANIIIATPGGMAVGAQVETKEGYYIELHHPILGGTDRDASFIGPAHKWDNSWVWIYFPDHILGTA